MDLASPASTARVAPSVAPTIAAPADLFALGRAAVVRRRERVGDRGVFVRSRQLLGTGAWRGPRDAAEAFVEQADLVELGGERGGMDRAAAEGARLLIASGDLDLARRAADAGFRVRVRVAFRAGQTADERAAQLNPLMNALSSGLPVEAVIPTPDGEPHGLDTLLLFARLRLDVPVDHVVADFARLGHRLAQMAIGFGADELMGPIVAERALRLGDNAHNPVMTRKEAALLLRGAGLAPHERLSGGELEEIQP